MSAAVMPRVNASGYTPFTLVNLRGPWGWSLFGLVWTLAGLGLAIGFTRLNRVRFLATGFYIAMGWVVVLAFEPLLAHVAPGDLWLLLVGGLCYTAGVAFYAWHSLAHNRAIWHLFVVGGGVLHFFAALFYLRPPAAG